MRLVAEVSLEEFEELSDGSGMLADAVTEIEIRQIDGLLSRTGRVLGIEPMSGLVAAQHGVAEGGSPIRVFYDAKE